MLDIDHSATATVIAAPERCMEVLGAPAGYPHWAALITAADQPEPGRVRLRARVLGLSVEMDCVVELAPGRAVLRRLPDDPADRERFEAEWTVAPAPDGSSVTLHVTAALDAPGPARLLRGRAQKALVDDLLSDLARRAASAG